MNKLPSESYIANWLFGFQQVCGGVGTAMSGASMENLKEYHAETRCASFSTETGTARLPLPCISENDLDTLPKRDFS